MGYGLWCVGAIAAWSLRDQSAWEEDGMRMHKMEIKEAKARALSLSLSMGSLKLCVLMGVILCWVDPGLN